jgi:hypothetical protein
LYTSLEAMFQYCLVAQPLDDSLFTSSGYSISLTVAFDVRSWKANIDFNGSIYTCQKTSQLTKG